MSPATSAALEECRTRTHAGTFGMAGIPPSSQHRRQRLDLTLLELDPREVVDGVLLANGVFLSSDPTPVGTMREVCPHCKSVALQLVLRRHHVKRSHLFCKQCTRCYDALCERGASILGIT